ncbi:MAG TPA: hypothetical protein ENG95_03685 [Nitrospirae bacterium]|nr:hypothetical protein [Nitrospirota bacterium]
MSGGFGCDRNIIVDTPEEVIAHLENELDAVPLSDSEVGSMFFIEIKEMPKAELEKLPEFDGC